MTGDENRLFGFGRVGLYNVRPHMPALFGLGVHGVSYWGTLWLLGIPLGSAAFLCYAAGAVVLVAGAWYPKLRLRNSQAFQIVGYSVLLAVLLFGANRAR